MSEPIIICPTCKTEIKLTESLAAPLIESTKREYEKRLAQKDADAAKREAALREREEAVSKAQQAIDDQVVEKLRLERTRIVAEEAKKAKLALQTDLDQKIRELSDLQVLLQQRDAKLAEAQQAQVDLIRKQRELDDAKRELDLTVEKRVQEGLVATREQAKREHRWMKRMGKGPDGAHAALRSARSLVRTPISKDSATLFRYRMMAIRTITLVMELEGFDQALDDEAHGYYREALTLGNPTEAKRELVRMYELTGRRGKVGPLLAEIEAEARPAVLAGGHEAVIELDLRRARIGLAAIAGADLNGDGKQDIVAARFFGTVELWTGNGATFTKAGDLTNSGWWRSLDNRGDTTRSTA